MNCGLCAEYCPFDAIKMDHDYELADYDRTGIGVHIHDKEKLSKPFSYWRKIAPTTAWEEAVDRGGWEHIDVIKQKQKSGAPIAKPGPTWDSPYVPPIVPVKEEAPAAETAQAGGEAVGTAAEAAPVEMSAEDAAKEERRKKREAALARKHAKEQGGEG